MGMEFDYEEEQDIDGEFDATEAVDDEVEFRSRTRSGVKFAVPLVDERDHGTTDKRRQLRQSSTTKDATSSDSGRKKSSTQGRVAFGNVNRESDDVGESDSTASGNRTSSSRSFERLHRRSDAPSSPSQDNRWRLNSTKSRSSASRFDGVVRTDDEDDRDDAYVTCPSDSDEDDEERDRHRDGSVAGSDARSKHRGESSPMIQQKATGNSIGARSEWSSPDRHYEQASTNRSVARSAGSDRQTPLLPHVRLGMYRGDSCLETFLAKFENISAYMQWTARDRLFHIRACLEGAAGQILWDAGPQTTTESIVRLLRARFGNENQAERFRAEVRNRRRQKGESLQSLYNDLCRLLALAYPGPANPTSTIVGRDAFLDALNNQSLRVRVLEREPRTIEEALNVASRLEAYERSPSCTVVGEYYDEPLKERGRNVRNMREPVGENHKDDVDKLAKKIEELQQRLERSEAIQQASSREQRVTVAAPVAYAYGNGQSTGVQMAPVSGSSFVQQPTYVVEPNVQSSTSLSRHATATGQQQQQQPLVDKSSKPCFYC